MSIVGVTNVTVGRNPAGLLEPFELEVSFECIEALQEDLEWRLVYVGDPEDKTKDQELDCIALGPIQRGALRFVFIADAPNYRLINKEDINGITIILLTGSYRNQEFVRVGWYIHNFFSDPQYIENPPDVDEMTLDDMLPKMQRVILADAPRVTRFHIEWDVPNPDLPAFLSGDIYNWKSINGPDVSTNSLDTRMTDSGEPQIANGSFFSNNTVMIPSEENVSQNYHNGVHSMNGPKLLTDEEIVPQMCSNSLEEDTEMGS